jgi:hypothetical protein
MPASVLGSGNVGIDTPVLKNEFAARMKGCHGHPCHHLS